MRHDETATVRTKDESTSNRLAVLRFPLIVAVVFIHARAIALSGGAVVTKANDTAPSGLILIELISQGLARTAVPLFFMMSGFLFFWKMEWNWPHYLLKLQARVRTLLIPFLFWNILTLLIFAVLQAAPVTRLMLSGRFPEIADMLPLQLAMYLVGVGTGPAAYQFWFIRDLLMLVVAAPIFQLLGSRFLPIATLILLVCWLLDIWPLKAPSIEAVGFFALGASFALRGRDPFLVDIAGRWLLAVYPVLLLAELLLPPTAWAVYLHRTGILVGAAAILYLTKFATTRADISRKLTALGTTSFFVFAAHEPLLTAVGKIALIVVSPASVWELLAIYLLAPIGVVGVLVAAYKVMEKHASRFLSIIAGNAGRRGFSVS